MKSIAVFAVLASLCTISVKAQAGAAAGASASARASAGAGAISKPAHIVEHEIIEEDVEHWPYCDEIYPGEPEHPVNPEKPCPENGPCIDFGAAGQFNAVIFGDYMGSAQVDGKIAVSGNANLANGFSAGLASDAPKCTETNVVVKGNLQWSSGTNTGDIAVGGQSQIAPEVLNGCKVVNNVAFDFAGAKARLTSLSQEYAGRKATATSSKVGEDGTLTLNFNGPSGLQFADIDASELANLKKIETPKGLYDDAVIVINVRGGAAQFSKVDMSGLKKFKVLFNFPDAGSIALRDTEFYGAILAPNGVIDANTASIYGPIFVNSMSGPITLKWKPLDCVSQCKVTGPESEQYNYGDKKKGSDSSEESTETSKDGTTVKKTVKKSSTSKDGSSSSSGSSTSSSTKSKEKSSSGSSGTKSGSTKKETSTSKSGSSGSSGTKSGSSGSTSSSSSSKKEGETIRTERVPEGKAGTKSGAESLAMPSALVAGILSIMLL